MVAIETDKKAVSSKYQNFVFIMQGFKVVVDLQDRNEESPLLAAGPWAATLRSAQEIKGLTVI
jgi:hypothetical protein